MSTNNFSRRDFLKVAGVTGIAALAASCTPSSPIPGGQATQAPATSKHSQPVSLKVWHGETPPNRVEVFQKIIDDFNAKNNGIVVAQETFNWPEAYAKVVSAIQAGNQPDLCFTMGSHMHAVRATGAIQPLTALYNVLNSEVNFYQKTLTPFQFEGEVLAIPMFGLTHLLVYREDLLEGLGMSAAPQTWDEFKATAEFLTGDGKYGITLPVSKHVYTDQCVTDFMVTNKADIFAPDGSLAFNSPQTIEAYQFYRSMYAYSPPDAPSMTWPEANASFLTGQSAMTLIFGAIFARLPNESPDFADRVKAAPFPLPPNGQRGVVGAPNAVMVLTDNQERKEASLQFIRYLATPEVNAYMLANMQPGLYMPVTEASAQSEIFWEQPVLQRYKESIQLAMDLTKDTVVFGFNHEKPHSEIAAIDGENMLAQVAQKVCVDNMDPAEAVAWGEQRMIELIS